MKRIEDFLSESGRACTVNELGEALGLSKSNIHNATELMMGFGVLDRMKGRGDRVRWFYFLKDRYSVEELAEMVPKRELKVPRLRKPRRQFVPGPLGRPRGKTEQELFMESYLGAIDERASTGGLRALAILGLPDIESVKTKMDSDKDYSFVPLKRSSISISATLKVKELSKDMRRLSNNELNFLKKLLKRYGWYPLIENLHTGYVKAKALKAGRYGGVLHFSKGSNSWDDVVSINMDFSVSNDLLLPSNEMQRWSSWNEFNTPRKEPVLGLYVKMLNEFIESGHQLVEITMKTRTAASARINLKYNIEKRGLQEQIEVTRVQEFVYLEKLS